MCVLTGIEAGANRDLITVCIPTYRRPSLLAHALQSCLAQSHRPLEIDIGDDSPGDDSELLASSFVLPAGVTLRYKRNRPGIGQARNVNSLFDNARGSRLMLLHDDDVLLTNAIAALAAAWLETPNVAAAYGMQQVLLESGEVSPGDTDFHNRHANRTPAYAGTQSDLLVCALWRQFPNNGYLIDSAAARAVRYRSFEEIGDPCDTDFSIRFALHSRGKAFAFINRMTSQYRMSWTGLNQSNDVSWKLFDYIVSLKHLTFAEDRAREHLLMQIAAKAAIENALQRRPSMALQILFSRFYSRHESRLKLLYHLSVIAAPSIASLRKFWPRTPRFGS